jgi:GntR family transcriptional regulator
MPAIPTIEPVKQRHRALYLAVRDELMRQVREGGFPPGSQLPSERDLTESLGVSRVILREALRVLEEDGVLARRHGVGTFVNEAQKLFTSALEVNLGLTEIIEQNGASAGTTLLRCDEIDAPDIAEHLGRKDGRVLRIERVRTADARPVAYTVDYVSPDDLSIESLASLERESLYALLERHGRFIASASARIVPVRAGYNISATLGLSPDAVMLMIEQVDLDAEGRPLVYSCEYHLRGAFEFTISRVRPSRDGTEAGRGKQSGRPETAS